MMKKQKWEYYENYNITDEMCIGGIFIYLFYDHAYQHLYLYSVKKENIFTIDKKFDVLK